MQLHNLKLVTVVAETVIMKDIAKEGVASGASGCTLTAGSGDGSRSARNAIATGASSTMKHEFVVAQDVAEKSSLTSHVRLTHVFEHYACIAWAADAHARRSEAYLAM